MSGQRKDLDEAIAAHQEVLKLLPESNSPRSTALNNFALTLREQFKDSGQLEELDKIISLLREAVGLLPVFHRYHNRPKLLNNLASSLNERFSKSGQRQDMVDAITAFNEAVNALPLGHPLVCDISSNLGIMLVDAYSHTHESEYLEKAISAYRVAVMCEGAPASKRFRAAKLWARFAENSLHESALDAYQAAIEFLPRIAMLGLDLQSRQQALTSGSDGLARNAAACAIRSGQYDKAVELLEEGRAVFWSQALQLRTPMTDLREVAPELEKKLRQISTVLEQGSFRDASRNLLSYSPQKVMSMEQEETHFHRLNVKWLDTVEEVRRLDGFQDFLGPSRLSTLQGAAINNPVVILNASDTGCAVLIIMSAGVQHIALADLSVATVTILVKLTHYAIAQGGRDEVELPEYRAQVESLVEQLPPFSDTLQLLRLPLEGRHIKQVSAIGTQPDHIFRYVLGVLWELVAEPVMHVLELQVNLLQTNHHLCWLFELNITCRNRTYHRIYGGARQDHLLSFQCMQRGYTIRRRRNAFLIMLFRHTPRPSVHSCAMSLFLPLSNHSK
jgi:tetratricopeptide (TPR) repeat protein